MKLLRIEGVNLAHCIGDTEDLSTRRGGSLMLLDAIDRIATENTAHLEKISTGASTGLFKVTGDGATARKSIEDILKSEPFRYGTFVIDEIDRPDVDFPQAEIAATAANRWRQMQGLSFSAMGLGSASAVCAVDEVRPGRQEKTVKVDTRLVSDSVSSRRKEGLDAKRRFYQKRLGPDFRDSFAEDFEGIASGPVAGLTPESLAGKIAVFYADGNRFGHIARDCKSASDLAAWDGYIKGQRLALLAKLLSHAAGRHYWRNGQALRLETLLWGGDELMFVVPGWCGLELARLFFDQTRGLRYPDRDSGQPLTHAAGLVFCHQQAPISRISQLAKALAEKGKANRETNSLNWLVLESFDHTGSDLDDYHTRRFKSAVNWSSLVLNPESLNHMVDDFAKIKNDLPRSAIVHITRALAEGRAFSREGKLNDLVRRARKQVATAGDEQTQATFKALWKHLHGEDWQDEPAGPDDLAAWIKLAELWDYCVKWPESRTDQGEQQ